MIHLLWTTIRIKTFLRTLSVWKNKAENPVSFRLVLAINDDTSEEEKTKLLEELNNLQINFNVILTDHTKKGVAFHSRQLALQLRHLEEKNMNDIVIFGSDDFFPPQHWDSILEKEFKDYSGCIIFNDLNKNTVVNTVQIPIMTLDTLRKLNYIIYHPAYKHFHSDVELYDVLDELKLVKDISETSPEIIFEHRHYTNGRRRLDDNDHLVRSFSAEDRQLYLERKNLSLEEKLKV